MKKAVLLISLCAIIVSACENKQDGDDVHKLEYCRGVKSYLNYLLNHILSK